MSPFAKLFLLVHKHFKVIAIILGVTFVVSTVYGVIKL